MAENSKTPIDVLKDLLDNCNVDMSSPSKARSRFVNRVMELAKSLTANQSTVGHGRREPCVIKIHSTVVDKMKRGMPKGTTQMTQAASQASDK